VYGGSALGVWRRVPAAKPAGRVALIWEDGSGRVKQGVSFEYRDNAAGTGWHWFYLRVERKNGELAWSSLIWVRYRQPAGVTRIAGRRWDPL
jgi:hypothetical protein